MLSYLQSADQSKGRHVHTYSSSFAIFLGLDVSLSDVIASDCGIVASLNIQG